MKHGSIMVQYRKTIVNHFLTEVMILFSINT